MFDLEQFERPKSFGSPRPSFRAMAAITTMVNFGCHEQPDCQELLLLLTNDGIYGLTLF